MRRIRFRIRTLLIVVALLAMLMGQLQFLFGRIARRDNAAAVGLGLVLADVFLLAQWICFRHARTLGVSQSQTSAFPHARADRSE
jgi:hypothetical protein